MFTGASAPIIDSEIEQRSYQVISKNLMSIFVEVCVNNTNIVKHDPSKVITYKLKKNQSDIYLKPFGVKIIKKHRSSECSAVILSKMPKSYIREEFNKMISQYPLLKRYNSFVVFEQHGYVGVKLVASGYK
jgi:hypothetical protein